MVNIQALKRSGRIRGNVLSMPISVISGFEAVNIPICRTKAAPLWQGPPPGETIVGEAAQRTKGLSAAFIRELMRRIAQASIARYGGTTVESDGIGEALDDMRFAGSKLNVKLPGGTQEMAVGRPPQARKIWRASRDKAGHSNNWEILVDVSAGHRAAALYHSVPAHSRT
jgi:hypothetical protein